MVSILLVELIIHSRPNCKALGALPGAPAVFDSFMARCGDFATQLDLAEVLFRCASRVAPLVCTLKPSALD